MQPACGRTDASDCQDSCSSIAPPAVWRTRLFPKRSWILGCRLLARTKIHLLTAALMDSLGNEAKAGRGEELQRGRGIRRRSYCSKTIISDAAAGKQPVCLLLAKQNICVQTRGAADINRPGHQPISPTLWKNAHSLFFSLPGTRRPLLHNKCRCGIFHRQ